MRGLFIDFPVIGHNWKQDAGIDELSVWSSMAALRSYQNGMGVRMGCTI